MMPWQGTIRPGWPFQPQASNLEKLRWCGIGEDYRPEPDVLVTDADDEPRQRFVDRVFAEIVSDTDDEPAPGEKEQWIAIKRRLYLAHPPCEALILIDPHRVDIRTDLRMTHGWASERLTEWLNSPDLRPPLPPVTRCNSAGQSGSGQK
jgi:hypothetical protein